MAEKQVPKQYRVTIHTGEDNGDKGDVVLVHNYKQILIKRDHEVVIGEHYLDVLKNSVVHTTAKNEAGEVIPVRIPRFSFSHEPV